MIAFLRELSPNIDQCELTFSARERIDVHSARQQHAAYAQALRECGAQLEYLDPAPGQPDGVFVEDTAVVLPELAIITQPGAESRRGETAAARSALLRHRPVRELTGAARLDGGDVLRIGRDLFVGVSRRSNAAGMAALEMLTAEFGYRVRPVNISGCLHLKTACTFIPPNFLVLNSAWVDPSAFGRRTVVAVDPAESGAANTLTLAGATLVSAAYPRTEQRLREAGVLTRAVDISELEKAEAGLTCLSLILE